jgi:hypothetical protein
MPACPFGSSLKSSGLLKKNDGRNYYFSRLISLIDQQLDQHTGAGGVAGMLIPLLSFIQVILSVELLAPRSEKIAPMLATGLDGLVGL